jgi:autotransporter-associated beta strand protein
MVAVPYSSPSAVTVANNVVVANGSGGTLVLGSAFTDGTSQTSYTGTLTLNGNLSFRSDNSAAAPTLLSGAISGAGNLTKIGSGVGTLGNAANTFTGITKVSEGTLNLGHIDAIKSSRLDVTGAGTVGFSVAGSNTYTLGGLVNHSGVAGMTIAAGTNSLTLDSTANSAVTITSGTDFASVPAISATAAAFTLGGNLTITFSNQLDQGTYSYQIVGGSTAGSFTSVSIDSSYTATLNAGNGYAANSGGNSFSFDNATGVLAVTAIPEPASVGMVMAALVGTITAARCRAKRLAAEV